MAFSPFLFSPPDAIRIQHRNYFPHGDPHIIENGRASKTVGMAKELARIVAHGLSRDRLMRPVSSKTRQI
jgi:hypothetical protein